MERNFILTDVMKSGYHQQLDNFLDYHTLAGQEITHNHQYYTVTNFPLDQYKKKLAIIDICNASYCLFDQQEFVEELDRRLIKLRNLGFAIIIANPWESLNNILNPAIAEKIKQVIERYTTDSKNLIWTGESSWFWQMMHERYQNKNFTVDHSTKKYDFLYLNKYPRSHRVRLFNRLESSNLLDNSLYSFLSEGKRLNPQYELPWVDANNYPFYGRDQDIYELPYNHSAYNIVSETHDRGDTFVTEKIWKPVIMQQMFVVHSTPHYLKTLRELGFQTFHSVLDESYDEEQNAGKRIDKIVELCKWLKDQDPVKMYKATESIRKHNAEHFFKESAVKSAVNATVLGLLKFFDSSQISS